MARASALHAEGHRFDSDILHKKFFVGFNGVIRSGESIGSSPTHLLVLIYQNKLFDILGKVVRICI